MADEATAIAEETDVPEESSPSEEIEEVEGETAESEQESDESPEGETEEDNLEQKPKKTNRVQQRISELTAEKKYERMRAEFFEKQYQESQQPAPQEVAQVAAPTQPGLPPDRYDFDDDAAYQAAIGSYQEKSTDYQRHLICEEMKAANQGTQQEHAQRQQLEEQQNASLRLKNIEDTGPEKYQDFNDVAFIPQDVAGFVSQFDNAVDIAYHWGKHPEERQEIVTLARTNPTLCAAKIGALDAKFAAKEKPITKAPPPPKPLGTRNKATSEPDPTKDFTAWKKWRNEAEAR